MNKLKNRILFLLLLLVSSFLLAACGSNKIEITATANKTLAGDQVATIPTINVKSDYELVWFKKALETDWEEIASFGNILYVNNIFGGKYSYKVVLKTEGKNFESNVVEVEFVETTGKVFGHASEIYLATSNIDFSFDNGEEGAKIIHKAANRTKDEYAYFKDINHTRYVISADVDLIGINASDPFPKTGLMAAKLNDNLIYFAFDVRPTYNHGDVVVVENTPSDGGTWKWPGLVNNIPGLTFRDEAGNRIKNNMTVIRDVENFYFLLNGSVIAQKKMNGLTQATFAGTYTMAQHAEFSNYYAIADDPNNNSDQYDIILRSVLNQIGG